MEETRNYSENKVLEFILRHIRHLEYDTYKVISYIDTFLSSMKVSDEVAVLSNSHEDK